MFVTATTASQDLIVQRRPVQTTVIKTDNALMVNVIAKQDLMENSARRKCALIIAQKEGLVLMENVYAKRVSTAW